MPESNPRRFPSPYYSALLSLLLFSASAVAQGIDYRILHRDAIVVDTHNDVVQRILQGDDLSVRTQRGHSDLPRFVEGGIDVQVFSIWVPPEKDGARYYTQANRQIDSIESFVRRNGTRIGIAYSVREVLHLVGEGKIAAMLGLEGGHHIENNLRKLEHFHKRGVRYMTLTWNNSTEWATSAKDEEIRAAKGGHRGLTERGRQIIRSMNELGMLIDVSHVGEQTFRDVMQTTRKPVIASHSSVWKICPNRRNLKDDQLQSIAANGGVVFINFAPFFIDSTYAGKEEALKTRLAGRIDSLRGRIGSSGYVKETAVKEFLDEEYRTIRPPLSLLVDHFVYVSSLIGVDHVGIGSDFDGITVTPLGMDDVSCLPNLTRELIARGFSGDDVRKILGGNFLRVLATAEKD